MTRRTFLAASALAAAQPLPQGRVQTVLGPLDPAALGPTLMHEHVLLDLVPPRLRAQPDPNPEITLANTFRINYGRVESKINYLLNQRDVAAAELKRMYAAGGRALCELTVGGLHPDPAGLAEVSRASGIHIVLGTGHYVHEYQDPANAARTPDSFAREMITHLTRGAWGTSIRSGIIGEIGLTHPWTPQEQNVLAGAVLAQQETNAALSLHPGRDPGAPLAAANFVKSRGGKIERTILGHLDRTLFSEDEVLRLADTGCVIQFDLFGQESSYYRRADIDMPNDALRLKLIRAAVRRGHGDRITISHDICYRTRLAAYGGHGYGHIFENVIPLMQRRGFTDGEIRAILAANPRRLLTL